MGDVPSMIVSSLLAQTLVLHWILKTNLHRLPVVPTVMQLLNSLHLMGNLIMGKKLTFGACELVRVIKLVSATLGYNLQKSIINCGWL